ncbi:MAG: hypothetical protein KAW12_14230 [Candidatus Aminicenantes bacterium]|nr:hypothetical protein [Candidatus Aminicenantes bacterium]
MIKIIPQHTIYTLSHSQRETFTAQRYLNPTPRLFLSIPGKKNNRSDE